MKKLLITGASGFLGWNLCQQAQKSWRIYGTYLTHAVFIPNIELMKVDLTNFGQLKNYLKKNSSILLFI